MHGPPTVLVGGAEELARWLEGVLTPHGYGVVSAATGGEVVEGARAGRPDAIILDYELPDTGAPQLCRALRMEPQVGAGVPVLVVTSQSPTRAERLASLRAGAWECLARPLDAEELAAIIDTYVRAKQEMDRARQVNLIDPTTGLYNRPGMARRARELGSQAFRQHAALACVVFAPAALEPGAATASEGQLDAPAARCAQVLKAVGRSSDAFGRLGPSEFAVLAPGTDAAGAVKLAERLAHALTRERRGGRPRAPFPLRAGYKAIANFGYEPIDPVALLYRAATALRAAKADASRGWIRSFQERS